MIIYLLVGLLLGTIFSFLVLKLRFTDTYISKAQFSELEKKFSEIQLQSACKLSKDDVSLNYVSKDLYQSVVSNLISANNNFEKEKR